jgi:hypothetical protein
MTNGRTLILPALCLALAGALPLAAQGRTLGGTRPAAIETITLGQRAAPAHPARQYPDLAVTAVRWNTTEKSVDVFVVNAGAAAGQTQVTLDVLNGTAVTKEVIEILPPTPAHGSQVLNFATAGWTPLLSSATALRVLVNSNGAVKEASMVNNTFYSSLNTAPLHPGRSMSFPNAPDLVVSSVERVPGQNAVRVRIANVGAGGEGGTPVVRVYALPAQFGTQTIGIGADTVHLSADNAASYLDWAWAKNETHVQGMPAGGSVEVVLSFPEKKADPGCGMFGCWGTGGNGPGGPTPWTSAETFAASLFYAEVSTSIEANTQNNGRLAGPFGP